MSRPIAPLLLLLGPLSVTTPAAAAQAADTAGMTSVRAGVYRLDQARRGEAVFRRVCVDCHATAQFRERRFLTAWAGGTARDVFELIRTQMPQDNPGRLRRDEYADVLAYIFELQGLPPGDTALPADDAPLRRIRIEGAAP
ncbi:MAG: c-type cytochrome [Gemmatimonadales bacterium]